MGRTQLNLRLGEGQKERWRDHAEESKYDDHITDLVKRAVESQIDRDNGEAEASTEGSSPSGEVLDKIQDLQGDVRDVEEAVSQALDALHGQEGMDPDLPPEVYGVLPRGEENAKTAEELVEESLASGGYGEAQARFVLENLERNMGDVHRSPEGMPSANPDDEVRWYVEE